MEIVNSADLNHLNNMKEGVAFFPLVETNAMQVPVDQ